MCDELERKEMMSDKINIAGYTNMSTNSMVTSGACTKNFQDYYVTDGMMEFLSFLDVHNF